MINMQAIRDLLWPIIRGIPEQHHIDFRLGVDWVKDALYLQSGEVREYPSCLSREGITESRYKTEFWPAAAAFAERIKPGASKPKNSNASN